MSKLAKAEQLVESHEDAFEMIELAVGDLDTLTRAFNLISEICEAREVTPQLDAAVPPKNLVN